MKPPVFKYTRVESVDEALAILGEEAGEAKVLAGGQSLVPLLNFRLARPRHLVDINRLGELAYVRRDDGGVRIGALTRQRELLTHSLFRHRCPILSAAGAAIGHPAIRNRGTIGGSVAHADPAAELPVVLLALEADVELRNRAGTRRVAASEFFTGLCATSAAADELLTQISFPLPPGGVGWGFHEVARRHGDFALATAAVLVALGGDRREQRAVIALGAVGDRPLRAREAEQLLAEVSLTPAVLDEAARLATASLDPPADIHASSAYRQHLARVLVRRALADAVSRAAGADERVRGAER